jgi:arsenical pump membrane protein
VSETLALIALAASLTAAVARSRRAPDWAVATLAAVVLVAAGVLCVHGARSALGRLGPTAGFLAALLVLADGCRRAGVFDALGALIAFGAHGQPRRRLALVFAAAPESRARASGCR